MDVPELPRSPAPVFTPPAPAGTEVEGSIFCDAMLLMFNIKAEIRDGWFLGEWQWRYIFI